MRTFGRSIAIALALLVWVGAAQGAVKPGKPNKPSKPIAAAKPKAQMISDMFLVQEDLRWGYIDKTGKVVMSGYEETGDFSDGLAHVTLDGRCGFIDPKGKMVVPVQYDGAGRFSEGLAPVRVGKVWGYVDRTGNIVIQPKYAKASEFSEGLAVVEIDGKCGAIDKTGAVVIQPIYLDMARPSEGLIAVIKDGKWGFIDRTEAVVIAPQFTRTDHFSCGLAPAQLGNKWGFIDKSGGWVVQPKHDGAQPFSEGLAAVGVQKEDWLRDDDGRVLKRQTFNLWGYIDITGKEVIPQEFVNAGRFSEGLASVWKDKQFGFIDKTGAMVVVSPYGANTGGFHNGLAKTNFGFMFGYIDEAGKMVIFPQFEKAQDFSEGLAAVQVGQRDSWWGYIDITGRMKIKPQFTTAYNFRNGLARVRGDIKWGIIDKTGKFTLDLQFGDIGWHTDKAIAATPKWNKPLWGFFDWSGKAILEPQFESARFLGDSLAIVRKDGKYGVVDASGKLVIPTQYDDTGWLFSEGLLPVSVGGKFGFIDAAGKSVIEPQYDAVGGFTPEGLCPVKVGDRWGFIDRTNKMVIPPQYDTAVCFCEDRAAVKVGDQWGFIDKAGKAIVEPKYELVGSFNCGLAPVLIERKWGYVDKAGKLAIPARFDSAQDFARNLAWVRLGNQGCYIDTTGKAVWMSRKYATAPAKAPKNISQAAVQIDCDGLRVVKVKVAADQVLRQRGAWREAVEKRMQAVSDLMEKSFKVRLDVIEHVSWDSPEFKASDDPDEYRDKIFDSLSKDLPLGDAETMIGLTARDPRLSVLGFAKFYLNWMIVYDRYNGAADKEEELVTTIAHELCHQFGAFHVTDKASIMHALAYPDQTSFDDYTTRQLNLMHDYDFAKGLDSLSQDKIKSAAAIHSEGHAPDIPFCVSWAYMYRAGNRWDDGDKAGAFRDYSRSFELGGGEPNFATVYRFGAALYNDGQRVLGIETLRKCYPLKTDPKYAALYHNYLANWLADLAKGDAAFVECRQAARPDLGEIYRRYLLTRISPDEVISEYRAAVTAEPKNASYHSKLGQALLDSGRSAEALAEYEQAVTLEPDNSYYKSRVEVVRAQVGAKPGGSQ